MHRHKDGSPNNAFLTLTYDNEHLPTDGSLQKREWQTFAKRTRKKAGPFRFLHVGEYGEQNFRPHYHALLFGLDFSKDRIIQNQGDENPLYTSNTVEALWPKGFHTIQLLTPETVNYVCRYALKTLSGEAKTEKYARQDGDGNTWTLASEYATMSRRPGIGAAWIAKFPTDVWPDDFIVVKGQKAGVPRFYSEKLKEENPELAEKIRAKRIKSAASRVMDNTHERRQVREEIAKDRVAKASQRKLD